MKQLLVKLNRPLLINNARTGEENEYIIIYGFFADFDESDRFYAVKESIRAYVGYLAALHCVSNGGDEFKPAANSDYIWIDEYGKTHSCKDGWSDSVGSQCMDKLDLDFTLYNIDVDDYDRCGELRQFITTKEHIDELVRLSEWQNEDKKETVVLFNRPIWLESNSLWPGEDGFTQIFGFVTKDRESDRRRIRNKADYYLGYLAMMEEIQLRGFTVSGYTNYCGKWLKDGEVYDGNSKEIFAENKACRDRNNLRNLGWMTIIGDDDYYQGKRDCFIVSKSQYEVLLDELIGVSK